MNNEEVQSIIDYLLPLALRKCGNTADAQDLMQETILALLTCQKEGKQIAHRRAWLTAVMNRKYYDFLSRKYQLPTVTIDDDSDLADSDDFVSDQIRREEAENVRREVAYLSGAYRVIIARHYFHGESIEKIAQEMNLPAGTVKSRLDFGRKQMKKGFEKMETYTESSYNPKSLIVRNSGCCGIAEEPMSLTDEDPLAQNLLILAYEKPVSIPELSKAIGVATAYVEPVINKLVDGELMKRMGDGKVYTDFILYRAEDYTRYMKEQEAFAEQYADAYLTPLRSAMEKLKQTDFYSLRLERYLMINIAENAVWDCMESHRKPQVCPDRPHGGKWIAFGTVYEKNYVIPEEKRGKEEYSLSGQRRTRIDQYLSASGLQLYNYETSLYPFPKHSEYGYIELWIPIEKSGSR